MIGMTLGRYLSARFFSMIAVVFLTLFGLVYVIDFVETLRRAGDKPGATAGFIAFLAFLRTPAVTEQVLPFCVLFGTMAAFLNLSRRLELIVARAAGISVWQFLVPPLGIALLLGITSVTILNPISAEMKQRADGIEAELFGGNGRKEGDNSIWVRQKSVDGQAIIRAENVLDGGSTLQSVTAYVYEPNGRFEERVDADTAKLLPGVWQLQNARVSAPGEDAQTVGNYLLATTLSRDQVAQTVASPDSVPFWDLPAFREQIETAGLDATGYRLQYQTLLARPLLLVAMVLLAAAFSLRFFRFGGIAKMVGGGVAAGFVLYVATKFVGDLGGAGLLSAPVAAWAPAVVASMLGALALLHQEDG
ncbi:LPS export ABC transporter permease LptG [Methyloferula stellata]|uniref:LPS export ABC transporter permease LptG n=1 Tax=Methyloferula stellata TaxID=876270 RepID=UPI0003664366|nr:LPS export ABC transporter permease LptG [Methyloferula stellata]